MSDPLHKCDQAEVEIIALKVKIEELEHPWISVDDRLPEEGRDWKFVNMECAWGVGFYIGDGKWLIGADEFKVSDVTHWMPIPTLEE